MEPSSENKELGIQNKAILVHHTTEHNTFKTKQLYFQYNALVPPPNYKTTKKQKKNKIFFLHHPAYSSK